MAEDKEDIEWPEIPEGLPDPPPIPEEPFSARRGTGADDTPHLPQPADSTTASSDDPDSFLQGVEVQEILGQMLIELMAVRQILEEELRS